MATARDIINGSLRLIGALASGETPQASDSSDALGALNDMLESWSNEKLIIPSMIEESFTLSSGQSLYTMGVGGDFDTSRPIRIETAVIVNGSSPSNDIRVDIITSNEFAKIGVKETQSSIPYSIYMEGSYPLARINVYPVPSVATTLKLFSWKPLTNLTNLSTEINLPPGFNRALRYNLAQELAPEYGREAGPTVQTVASRSLSNIKRINTKPIYLACDAGTLGNRNAGSWDYRTGEGR